MVGLLSYLAGGLAEGVGDGIYTKAMADHKAALIELERQRDAQNSQALEAQREKAESDLEGKRETNDVKIKQMEIDAADRRARAENPFLGTGQPTTGSPSGNKPTTDGQPNDGPHGDAFLANLPTGTAAQVKALAEGRLQFPSGFALKSRYWQTMLTAVSQYDPSFDAVNYNARSKTRADFTSGVSARNIKSLNTAIGHLGTLAGQIGDTTGTSGYLGATLVNRVANTLRQSTGDPGITNFKQTAGALASELTSVFRGSGGAEADVKRYLSELDPNASTDQKRAAVQNITNLLSSRLQALGDSYSKGMGTTHDPLSLLDPHAADVLRSLSGDNGASSQASAPSQQASQPQVQQASPPRFAVQPTDADIAYTARKYGLTPDQVRQQLGLR